MKILAISTTVFSLPPKGYSGLEALVWQWATLFHQAGHQVTVVCPKDSWFPEGIEIIETELREPEEQSYQRYKDKLLAGEWDVCLDSTWLWHTVLAQMETEKQLPVIHVYHSDPHFLGSPPPIKYPCLVSLSDAQGRIISQKWKPNWAFPITKTVYNGIDLQLYKPDPAVQRSDRYLFMGRYTPEKCPLLAIELAKKYNVPLDLYGDIEIIGSQDYLKKVKAECNESQIVFHEGVSREETVNLYQNHKALIHIVSYLEAFGLVPVEAMACGMPVLVNHRGAFPETIADGKSGFIVDSLEEAETIIREDKVSTLKSEDCVAQASKFSIEASARGYLKLFEGVLNGHYW